MAFENFQGKYFQVEDRDGVAVATFTVPLLNEEENVEQLGRELFSLMDEYNCDRVVVNLENVEYLTSSVLGKMITLHRRLHRNHGTMAICNFTKTVDEILRTSRLLQYFHVGDSVDEAVQLLKG